MPQALQAAKGFPCEYFLIADWSQTILRQDDITSRRNSASTNNNYQPFVITTVLIITTMSLPRTARPISSATLSFLRTAFAGNQPYGWRCSQCLRQFSSTKPSRFTQVRSLQTATAYKPSSFNVDPPPRSSDIPDTSIAGPRPEVNETRPPLQTEQRAIKSEEATKQRTAVSETEKEAQNTRPAGTTTLETAAPPSPSPPKPTQRKSRLKPRKAALTISQTAITALRELLDQPEPKLIRVGVKNRGCSGLAYNLEYVEKPGSFDETVEQDGVKVLIDSKALFSIIGSEMDWVEDKLSQRFVFKNPNISESTKLSLSDKTG